jgi:hypothetical protein
MDADSSLSRVISALRTNRFNAELAEDCDAAKRRLLELVPGHAVVGFGNSATLQQIGIFGALEERGSVVKNPITREITHAGAQVLEAALRHSLGADVYIAGVNAITLDGKLVYIDGAGNRIAGIIFGAPRTIVVAGQNKIVRDVDEALSRIRNVIAPAMMRRRRRSTPCVNLGRCADCSIPERVCNITAIIEKKPIFTDLNVMLVDQDLGLGWDPCWTEERIQRIWSNYEASSWPYTVVASGRQRDLNEITSDPLTTD